MAWIDRNAPRAALVALALMAGGCTALAPRDSPLPREGATMSEIYKNHMTGAPADGVLASAVPRHLLPLRGADEDAIVAERRRLSEPIDNRFERLPNPYDDYINLARGEGWKVEVNAGSNVLEAKENVATNGGKKGIQAFQGLQLGGKGQPPVRIVFHSAAVGYNVTMNRPPASSWDTAYPDTTRLGRLWPSPRAAADWGVSVLGDQEVATCEDSDCGIGDGGTGKAVTTGLGLQPKYEASVTEIGNTLADLVASGDTRYDALQTVSAPGVGITRDVIEALRRLPPETRSVAITRLTREVALANTIERAFTLRNMMLSGITALNYEKPADDATKRVAQLNRYIDDLMFEQRVRKEIVSSTAQLLIENDRNAAAARSTAVPDGREMTTRPLEDGRVQ
jgi:integrating conjugative element protein (TIGR03755 family)